MQYLRRSWTLPNDSKHNEASFSTISTGKLYLRFAQMPRSPDLAIFVLTTDDRRQTTDKTDHITPCACARGNNNSERSEVSTRARVSSYGFWAYISRASKFSFLLSSAIQAMSPAVTASKVVGSLKMVMQGLQILRFGWTVLTR